MAEGEFVVVVGPSGCGKTTLLNNIAGFEKPDRGEVIVNGNPVTGPSRQGIVISQLGSVFPWLTVQQNLMFGLKGMPKDETRRMAQHYIDLVGLKGFEQSFPYQISGGMLKRVEVARALAVRSEIIYMDEPLAALDALTRFRMRIELLQILSKERHTCLLVTHDVEEALHLADRIFVLSPRPTKVDSIVEVQMPHPRRLTSPELLQLKEKILRQLGVDTESSVVVNESAPEVSRSASKRKDQRTDALIIGGGPGGAASGMFLARQGIQPVIVEKGTFPRYHVGESMSGECGAIVRMLGLQPEMLRHRFPLKRGLAVYGNEENNSWFIPVTARDENWKMFECETWQVRRSDFDKMILDEAVARGATLIHGQATKPLLNDDGSVRGAQIRMADGTNQEIESEILLDCSGQASFLANARVTGPKYVGSYDKQIAIFSQVAGALRGEGKHRDDTLIFYKEKYTWSWFIPLDEEVVSVGVVIPVAYFLEKKESKRDFLIRELHELHPELMRRIPEAKLVEDVRVIPNYSYQVRRFCGKGFICIGDAHRFIDPIFSFGLVVALREAHFAAPLVKAYLEGSRRDDPNPFAYYQLSCEKGIDVLEDLIDAFWENPAAFSALVGSDDGEYMADIFAGRVYERQPSPAAVACRRMLQRERSYEEDHYSVPIGSRYHPEHASIWTANSPIPSTEEWMRSR